MVRVRADDADSGENGYVAYAIANLNEVPFEVDPFSGVIKTTRLIDFESDRREYHLLVRASDWGTPFRYTECVNSLVARFARQFL